LLFPIYNAVIFDPVSSGAPEMAMLVLVVTVVTTAKYVPRPSVYFMASPRCIAAVSDIVIVDVLAGVAV
jgi:hypothetical protein